MFMSKLFIFKSHNQDGNESAILEIKHYTPPNLIFQHIPVKKSKKHRGYFYEEGLYYRYFNKRWFSRNSNSWKEG